MTASWRARNALISTFLDGDQRAFSLHFSSAIHGWLQSTLTTPA